MKNGRVVRIAEVVDTEVRFSGERREIAWIVHFRNKKPQQWVLLHNFQ